MLALLVALFAATMQPASVSIYGCENDMGPPFHAGFCAGDVTRSGVPLREGIAACGSDFPQGTVFGIIGDPEQRVWVCLDTGLLPDNRVEPWFHSVKRGMELLAQVGTEANIMVIGGE